jgi:microcystin degradation protein MlrC
MPRIAVGGFHHETNTFAPTKAQYRDFEEPDGWPGLSRGPALLEAVAGINIPVAGFLEAAADDGHAVLPLLWCSAPPSAHVTRDAYERIVEMMLADLKASLPVDALYFDLHGAMVTEHLEDGEGELLRRARAILGPSVPIVVSLDFHANITPLMAQCADALVVYRTYPHVDMAGTGRRAARLLFRILDGKPLAKAYRQSPFLVPLTWQCTLTEPARSVYESVAAAEHGALASTSLAMGFPLADIRECGPTILAYADSAKAAETAADSLLDTLVRRENEFAGKLWEPAEAVRHAMAVARKGAGRPVVLADTQDNPGAGGNGDTTGLLKAMVEARAEGAVLGLLADLETAKTAHRAGEGAEITIGIGEKSGVPGHVPFNATFHVERAASGEFTATGPFYEGSRMKLGPMALLRIGGVRVAVSGRKQQCADQAMLRHVGIEPKDQKILGLKSSVHFRADFQPIAQEILIVVAPGPNIADLAKLPYKNLRPGLRVTPGGKAFLR